jgi:hypothetical protein
VAPGPAGGRGTVAPVPALSDVTDELVSLVALERARLDQGGRAEVRLAEDLVRLLDGAGDTVEVRAALRACRMPPDSTFLVATAGILGTPGGATAAPLATYLLDELVRPLSADAVVGQTGDTALAVLAVPADPPGTTIERLRQAARSLAPGLGPLRLAIGVGSPADGAAALPGAAEAARHTYRTAILFTEPTTVVSSGEMASHALLLAGIGPAARQSFRDLLLGPLIDYDRAHHADLVATLDAFLRCSGSWQRCAEEMHVHVNTLRYRLQRVEHLTGRDLSRFEDRVDFFLALRL